MMKSLPQPVREMLEKAEASANQAREELKKERDNRRDEQYVSKASAWSSLTVDPQNLGPALRKLSDIDATLGEVIEKALESANAQAESASIFDEIGRGSRPTEGNAFAKVETLAKAAFVAGEYSTVEQAMTGVILKNPDLYADYRKEQ
jgi:dsDNA-specific endonuclease/ATPase MutS2